MNDLSKHGDAPGRDFGALHSAFHMPRSAL